MIYFWAIVLIIINGFWLILDLFWLPGNWLIVITTSLFAWRQWENKVISIYPLIGMGVLALLGEIVEFFAGAGGAKRAGAGRLGAIAAIFGSIAGAIAGTFFIPLPGTIIGACLGAGAAAAIVEMIVGKPAATSIRSGIGASAGYLIGTTTKFAIGIILWLTAAIAAFWP
jgi:uncharacterized protein YqgC (DUF456 family)